MRVRAVALWTRHCPFSRALASRAPVARTPAPSCRQGTGRRGGARVRVRVGRPTLALTLLAPMPCLLRCHHPSQHAHTCWQPRAHVALPRLLPVLCTTRQRPACRRSPPPSASSASPPQSCWQPRGCLQRPSSRQPCSLPSQRACSSPLKKLLVSEGGNSARGGGGGAWAAC